MSVNEGMTFIYLISKECHWKRTPNPGVFVQVTMTQITVIYAIYICRVLDLNSSKIIRISCRPRRLDLY